MVYIGKLIVIIGKVQRFACSVGVLCQIPRRVVCVVVGPRVGMHALNHPPQHVVCVCGGKAVRVGGGGELPYGVVLEQGHRVHRCNCPHLQPEAVLQHRHVVAHRVGHGGAEETLRTAAVETVIRGGGTPIGLHGKHRPVKDVVGGHGGRGGVVLRIV